MNPINRPAIASELWRADAGQPDLDATVQDHAVTVGNPRHDGAFAGLQRVQRPGAGGRDRGGEQHQDGKDDRPRHAA